MFNPTDDLAAVADGLEAVTLLRRNRDRDEGEAIPHAFRRAITAAQASIIKQGDVRKNVVTDGKCTEAEVVWHLPAAEMTGPPLLGDIILDSAAQRWTILEVKLTTLGSRWRCETHNVAVVFGLDDTVTVVKAVEGYEGQWRTWRTGIRARVQPMARAMYPNAGVPHTTASYRIFLEENVELDHTCAIRGSDGTIYSIQNTSGMDRIGELQVIEAEVVLE